MRLSFTFAASMMLLSLVQSAHAACDDRPGTPNQVQLLPGPPGGLDLLWHNTASEQVIFDIAVFKNGKELQGIDPRRVFKKGNLIGYHLTKLDYAANYCFKIRARTGLDYRGGCVSAQWSQTVCGHPTSPRL